MASKIKVSTVQLPLPGEIISREKMLREALRLVEDAGRKNADIVCLPETFNVTGIPHSEKHKFAAVIPGTLFEQFSVIAKNYKMYIILSIMEKRGDGFFNTAVIIDREGKVKGRYDKVHLTEEEKVKSGITAGHDIPVFDLDFGRIGIMICYDNWFPETARVLALQEAKIIFFPHMQAGPGVSYWEKQNCTRAWDNSVYLVSSSYGTVSPLPFMPGRSASGSCIIRPDGTIAADVGSGTGEITWETDLNFSRLFPAAPEHIMEFREMILRDRKPSLYKVISGNGYIVNSN
ncbi:MAG: carbon-nitrogen hydrolase family protein [Victivallaceae bacterium]|nr:carbon-nitrogen hydrolase family protein [Victivallaceae bacterium]